MPKARKSTIALAIFTALCINGSALAAPRDGQRSDLKSRIKIIIVRILDDIRMGFPGG